MNKIIKRISTIAIAASCCLAIGFSACTDDNGDSSSSSSSSGGSSAQTNSYTITFDYNYSGSTSTTQTVTEGSTVTKPTDPSRDGYTFDDWYTTSACTSGTEVDFTAKIYADATYYAGWTEESTTVEYTVTFVLYDDTTETQTVESGSTVSAPATDPERSGYIFSGWYADEDLSESFDFSAEITADTTIYADWVVVQEGYVAITYMWNYEGAGVYKVYTQESNNRLSYNPVAQRSGYYFKGWYTDADCTTAYSFNSARVTENFTLYAYWYEGYTFEAEYTNFEDEYEEPRQFYDYSGNLSGTQAIMADTTGTASNGYYVTGLNVNGAYIYFEIESEEAVTDAVLTLRLAMAYGYGTNVTISSDEFTVDVNGTTVSYSTLSLGGPSSISEITNFSDFELSNISLNAGTNTITLTATNNTNGEGGTQWSKTPVIDCIKVYTNTTLSWEPLTSNIK